VPKRKPLVTPTRKLAQDRVVVTLTRRITVGGLRGPTGILDLYGGYTSLPVSGGGTGKFRVAKQNSRWLWATPLGNAFIMKGIYAVVGDSHVPDNGVTYDTKATTKYGDVNLTWGPQQNRRLKSWGFNTVTEYSSGYVEPWQTHASWPGDHTQPVKVPAIPFPIQASSYARRNLFGYIAGGVNASIKNLYNTLSGDAAYLAAGGYIGQFPDVYDAKFATYIAGRLTNDFATYAASPYLLGLSFDDGDYVTGFGAGHDFVPAQSAYHPHLGYVVACTSPTQVSDTPEGTSVTFTDQVVYSKNAWRDFLIARYGTIGALNTAWGTSSFYTTFNSTGTWGTGTGLLDEDGRHSWMGTSFSALTGANATTKVDLDDFLYAIAAKYFTTYRAAIDLAYPGVLSLGPTTVGAWNAPARRQVCQAAGESLQVLRISTDYSQGQADFVAQYAGDIPTMTWMGAVANPDSNLWRYANGTQADQFSTQAARGAFYASNVSTCLARTVSATGSKPFIGWQWWQYLDNWAEKSNWGIVTLGDNAYDGVEAMIATGTDAWGFGYGGEEINCGNVLGQMIAANAAVEAELFL